MPLMSGMSPSILHQAAKKKKKAKTPDAVVPSEPTEPTRKPLPARPEASDYEKLQVMKAKTMYEAWPNVSEGVLY